jgi:hypothetical protein
LEAPRLRVAPVQIIVLASRPRACEHGRGREVTEPVHAVEREEVAMPFTSPGGTPRYPTRAEIRHDEAELAAAILDGASHRPEQAFGHYYEGRRASCALGAAYEGMYRLPADAEGIRPRYLERLFDCLEHTLRRCPEGCKKRLPLGAIILHLNDDHHWTRERIAQWVTAPAPPAPPSSSGGAARH